MRFEMAMTKNMRRFLAAVRELNDRPVGVEGMAILWGEPGEGKSTALAYACNALDGIHFRAWPRWTPRKMLAALMVELGRPAENQISPMIDAAVHSLSEQPRPVFIDEADYLFGDPDMLEIMRGIYDVTGAPVVLIGMEDFARKVQAKGKFARRITQWVEFSGIDADDARTLADTTCKVKVADDLLDYLYKDAHKNIGRMITGLARIEQFAKLNALATVTRKEWANRDLFYDQPRFAKRRA